MHTVLIYIRPKIAMCPVHYIVADTPFRWDIPCSGAETRLYLYIYPVFPTGS